MDNSKIYIRNKILGEMTVGGYVPSKSNPQTKHFVFKDKDGWHCDCIAGSMGALCHHKKIMAERTGETGVCWYCGTTEWAAGGLESHHIFRRSTHPEIKKDLKYQALLCKKCHNRATNDHEFEDNLQNIWRLKNETKIRSNNK